MGNCNFENEKTEGVNGLSKNSFQLHYIVGNGGFGKVWKVEYKKNKEVYAMKEMSKYKIYMKKSVVSVMNEKKLLEVLKHPFIVNMHHAYQDTENLYLVMDYLSGGDLRYHLIKRSTFTENETKFIIACILVALEFIHIKNILHRDIKPENLVFNDKGYLKITDFGISRIWSPKNENDTSGTPGYMAPEVMLKSGHGIASDLFAVGVIAYECMLGKRPYIGHSRKDIRELMINKQAKVTNNEKPSDWSIHACDFVNQLLQRKPNQRLGNDNPGNAKLHPWFEGYNWDDLISQKMKSPFEGINVDEKTLSNYLRPATEENPEEKNNFLRNFQMQKLFADYYYDKVKSTATTTDNTPPPSSATANTKIATYPDKI